MCAKGFKSSRGVKNHLSQSPHCLKSVQLSMLAQKHATTKTIQQTLDLTTSHSFVPWEEESSTSSAESSTELTMDNEKESLELTNTEENTAYTNVAQVRNNEQSLNGCSFTSNQLAETKLLKMLDEAKAPLFLYAKVMDWAKESLKDGYNFQPERKRR